MVSDRVSQLAVDLLPWARGSVVAVFALLATVAVARARRSAAAGWWAAATFGSLAVVLLGRRAEALGTELPAWLQTVEVVLILVFPYLLLRFTASFRDLPRWLELAAAAAAAGVVVATIVLPPCRRTPSPRRRGPARTSPSCSRTGWGCRW
jgi:peptidoglycan/LPS O-acetylase OafA/YrhL